jgi:predicted DCC family thiol-disulfide oxidoreductase YuxK
MTQAPNNKLQLFYDSQCPLCQAEILFLQSRNKKNLLEFIDVSDRQYSASDFQISCDAALDNMHGKFSDGQIIVGVPVFAEAYRRADLPFLAWIFSRTWTQPFLKPAYKIFAKYRHQISGTIGPTLLKLAQKRYLK